MGVEGRSMTRPLDPYPYRTGHGTRGRYMVKYADIIEFAPRQGYQQDFAKYPPEALMHIPAAERFAITEEPVCTCGMRVFTVHDRILHEDIRAHVGGLDPYNMAHDAVRAFLKAEREKVAA